MTKINEENEQMVEINEENDQMYKESSSKKPKYRDVPSWVSPEGKVNIESTDHVDQVLRKILEKLDKYSPELRECERQIHVNNLYSNDHKPIVVSIGSNYRDTIEPNVIEVHKLKYLKDFVERIESNLEVLARVNLELISKIWQPETLEGFIKESLEMFILDGCFIIELFLKNTQGRKMDDPLFKSEWVLCALSRDLILPYNQLPFWFLSELCKHWSLSVKPDQDNGDHLKHITKLASKFLKRIAPNQKLNHELVDTGKVNQDLTGIVYDGFNWSLTHQANNNYNSNIDIYEEDGDDKWNLVKSATELEEFGVEFKKIEIDNFNFIDIKFTKKGVLEIPRLRIRYGTPYSIKVLLGYEVEQRHLQHRYLNSYLWFMNSLIKSPNDVQLLRQKGIIDNLSELPDDVAIHKFLKDIYGSVMISCNNFSYIQLCMDLNSHCSHRRNTWMPKLKRDYFNNPWTVISLLAASLLLILTVAQTVFSALSYNNQG